MPKEALEIKMLLEDDATTDVFTEWYEENGGYSLSVEALRVIARSELFDRFNDDDKITVGDIDDLFVEYDNVVDWAKENNLPNWENMSEDAIWDALDEKCIFHIISSERILTCA